MQTTRSGASTTSLDVEIHQVIWLDRKFTSDEISSFVAGSGDAYTNEFNSVIDISTERSSGRKVAFYNFVDGLNTATDKGGDSVDFDTLGWQGNPVWNDSNLFESPTPTIVLEWIDNNSLTSAGSLNLGNIELGGSYKSRLRFKNTGDADLTSISTSVSGDISIDTDLPSSLSSGSEDDLIIALTTSGSNGDSQSGTLTISSSELADYTHTFTFTLRDTSETRTISPHDDWDGSRGSGYSNSGGGGEAVPTESSTAEGSGFSYRVFGRPWIAAYGSWLYTESNTLDVFVPAGTEDPGGIAYVDFYCEGTKKRIYTQTTGLVTDDNNIPIHSDLINEGIDTLWGYKATIDLSEASPLQGDVDIFVNIVPINGLNRVVKFTVTFNPNAGSVGDLYSTRTSVSHVDADTLFDALRDAEENEAIILSDAGGSFTWPTSESGSNNILSRPTLVEPANGKSLGDIIVGGPGKENLFRPKLQRIFFKNIEFRTDDIAYYYGSLINYTITAVSTANDSVTVASDLTNVLAPGDRVYLTSSTGKTGWWTIDTLSESSGSTTVVFVEDIQDSTVDGSLRIPSVTTFINCSWVDSNGATGPTYGYRDGEVTQQMLRGNEGQRCTLIGGYWDNYLGPTGASCIYGQKVVASFDSIIYVSQNHPGSYGMGYCLFRPTQDFKQRKSLENTLTISSVTADTPEAGKTRIAFSGSPTLYGSGFAGEKLRVVNAASASLDSDNLWDIVTSGVDSDGFTIDVEDPDDTAELLASSDVVWTYIVAHADSGQFITDSRYSVDAVSTAADTFTVNDTDLTDDIVVGRQIEIKGSTGNDGFYTVSNISFSTNTTITVSEDIPSSTADGYLKIVDHYHEGILSGNYDSYYFSSTEANPQPWFDNNAANDTTRNTAIVNVIIDHDGVGSAQTQWNTKKEHVVWDAVTHIGCNFAFGDETEINCAILDSIFLQMNDDGNEVAINNNHFISGTERGDWTSTGEITLGSNYEPVSVVDNRLYFHGAGFRRPVDIYGNAIVYDATSAIGAVDGAPTIIVTPDPEPEPDAGNSRPRRPLSLISSNNSTPTVNIRGISSARAGVDPLLEKSIGNPQIRGPVTIDFGAIPRGQEIRYTTNNRNPTSKSKLYTGPFRVFQNLTGVDNTVIKARYFDPNNPNFKSKIVKVQFRLF